LLGNQVGEFGRGEGVDFREWDSFVIVIIVFLYI